MSAVVSEHPRWLSERSESKPRNSLDDALDEAECLPRPADRYVAAYALALQVAARALTGRPRRRSLRSRDGRARNVWQVLAEVAPDLAEWAEFFALLQLKRQAVEAGASGLVTAREADDLVRAVRDFSRAAERHG